ncbi:transcriptional regulator [Pedobacter lusitanus]|uniref:Transcriptional regulator n=1 Tax=Pedobacter lusitanus TaxID=1503925 RepID=A0A0D0GG00_9SPHI|nr:response regulator transcription factor [Pedobacter lusitanus]KIO75070.1 transcriptional regulator [Pedobacter lusitanus]
MSFKVLYVEDEPFLSHIVSDGLKNSGYIVQVVADGDLVMDAYFSLNPDICILDIMLPSKDGYTLAKELRKAQPDLPIIFLSAKLLPEDVVKGFKSGGNDYLKKPFSMDELLVRMEALLQRFGKDIIGLETENSKIYAFANCRLDTVLQKLTTSSGEHSLSFKECALLEMMILRKNDVLERQEALIKIWGDDNYYNTRSMDVFMTHLRKLLKDEPGIQIMNLRSIGYKLIC